MHEITEINIMANIFRHLDSNERFISSYTYSEIFGRNAKKRPFITLCGFHAGLWPQHLPPGMTFFLIIISIGCMEYQSKKENDIF